MFFRSAAALTYVLASSTFLAAATPWNTTPTPTPTPTTVTTTVTTKVPVTTTVTVTPPATSTIPASQCNTGAVQCCNSVEQADSLSAAALLGLLNVVVSDVTALVGITCTPITVIGVGGNSCTAQPVCCQNNTFNGIIAIGCVPITL